MDPYIRIYCESDFDFQYKLDSTHVNMPFKFIFFTVDINENFVCTFDGSEYVHCTKVDDNSIVFHIDGNTFSCGNLRIRKEYFIDSASFDDNICNSIDVEKTNIYIIEEGSNANSVVYEGSTLPNFDAVLIGERAEQALIEIDEKETELDNILGEAQLWENRIETIENNYITQSDLSNYVTDTELDNALNGYATEAYVQEKIDAIPQTDLSEYATKTYVVDYVATYAPQPDLSNYVTKNDLNNAGYISSIPSEYITDNELSQVLTSYITQEELSANSYLTQHQDLSNYVTKNDLSNASYATQSYVQDKINEIPGVDLSDYPTYAYTDANYVTYTYLANEIEDIVAGTVDLSNYVKKDELNSTLVSYVKQEELNNASYATQTYVQNKIDSIPSVDLSAYITNDELSQELASYVTKTELSNAGYLTSIPSEYITENELSQVLTSYITQEELSANSYLTQHQDLSNYVTKNELNSASYATKSYVVDYVSQHTPTPDMSAYVTKTELNNAGYISSIPSEYITENELNGMSYATQSYVMDKVNAIQPVTYELTYETTYETISIWQGTYAMYQLLPDYTTYQLYLIQQE